MNRVSSLMLAIALTATAAVQATEAEFEKKLRHGSGDEETYCDGLLGQLGI